MEPNVRRKSVPLLLCHSKEQDKILNVYMIVYINMKFMVRVIMKELFQAGDGRGQSLY